MLDERHLKTTMAGFGIGRSVYFQQWTFDRPMYVSKKENEKLIALQKVMYKMIVHFVRNYGDYQELMPLSAEATHVLKIFEKKPYQPGTYRTDFVYDPEGKMRIIEITCRFALNGMFVPAILNPLAEDYRKDKHPDLATNDHYSGIEKYLCSLIGDAKRIIILTGGDRRNSSKMYADIFRISGIPVSFVEYQDLNENEDDFSDAWVISELALEEIEALSEATVKKLADCNIINDFRTVMLIHDKRFFSVLGDEHLRATALSKDEINTLDEFYIPTYGSNQEPEVWEQARRNKQDWIIKHRSLGKSQQIYAGPVTSPEKWEEICTGTDLENLVLQRWIPQRKVEGTVAGEKVSDYITGTALFFNDRYFGLGDFRTSSFPVTNVVDHRKRFSLVLAEDRPELTEGQFQSLES